MSLVLGNVAKLFLPRYNFIGCLSHIRSCLSIFFLSLNSLCPQYLTELLEHQILTRSLCSSFQDLLCSQFIKPKHMVIELFLYVFKDLEHCPIEKKLIQDSLLYVFKKKLKTFPFTKFVESNSLYYTCFGF